jgi:predicted esterase
VGDAEEAGVILLAPDSRGRTWDAILDGYGTDVAFVDRALAQTFGRLAVDPASVGIEGFSDGASYALGLGLANGDLFRRGVAFSPGYVPSAPTSGRPSIFVSHGVGDDILPIDRCSRRIVPALRRQGYDVDYREFDGGHEVPADIAAGALASVAKAAR